MTSIHKTTLTYAGEIELESIEQQSNSSQKRKVQITLSRYVKSSPFANLFMIFRNCNRIVKAELTAKIGRTRNLIGSNILIEEKIKWMRTKHSWTERNSLIFNTKRIENLFLRRFNEVIERIPAVEVALSLRHDIVSVTKDAHLTLQYILRRSTGDMKEKQLKIIFSKTWYLIHQDTSALVTEFWIIQLYQTVVTLKEHSLRITVMSIYGKTSSESKTLRLTDLMPQTSWRKKIKTEPSPLGTTANSCSHIPKPFLAYFPPLSLD